MQKQTKENFNTPTENKVPNKSFHQYLKRDQLLTNKKLLSNNSSGKSNPNSYSKNRSQSPYSNFFAEDHQIDKLRRKSPDRRKVIHKIDISDKIVKTISNEKFTPD